MKTAKEFWISKFPDAEKNWQKTGHDDNFQVRMMEEYAKYYYEQQVKTCAIQIVTCCGFSVGDKVNTPYSEGEVWKVTETSVHVKHWDEKREAWMFSKYLTEPYHHSQNPVTVLSYCR